MNLKFRGKNKTCLVFHRQYFMELALRYSLMELVLQFKLAQFTQAVDRDQKLLISKKGSRFQIIAPIEVSDKEFDRFEVGHLFTSVAQIYQKLLSLTPRYPEEALEVI